MLEQFEEGVDSLFIFGVKFKKINGHEYAN
jgi:hypothetical protein